MSGRRARVNPSRDLDFAGFAQEFLRRNPAYRSDYRAMLRAIAGSARTVAPEVMARRWGLRFSMLAGRYPHH